MKETRLLMGMPITVEVVDATVLPKDIDEVFAYFEYIDNTFSTYKKTSEITKINTGKLKVNNYSKDMKTILQLSEQTRKETNGYFNINHNGLLDPSGVVKGWAINNAANLLKKKFKHYYVDAGGDIQVAGKNSKGKKWSVGIRNPFNREEVVKVLEVSNKGVATSGTYIRGQHIYNPKDGKDPLSEVVSMTVIGANILEADRFATAAFAMGSRGIAFIENLPAFEGYMITKDGLATFTTGFNAYVKHSN